MLAEVTGTAPEHGAPLLCGTPAPFMRIRVWASLACGELSRALREPALPAFAVELHASISCRHGRACLSDSNM